MSKLKPQCFIHCLDVQLISGKSVIDILYNSIFGNTNCILLKHILKFWNKFSQTLNRVDLFHCLKTTENIDPCILHLMQILIKYAN